jgi:hypothetical protein
MLVEAEFGPAKVKEIAETVGLDALPDVLHRIDGSLLAVIRNNSVGLSDLLFQSIIMMQSTEDRLRADSVTGGKQMPMAAGRNTRLDRFGCARA